MAILLTDSKRKYQRIRLNTSEKKELVDIGLTPVLSSNVSAIAKQGASLIVRFHGGATYEYPTSGKLYARMLNSTSKGKFVWNQLRRKNVPYFRTSNIPMQYDKDVKDRDLMEEAEFKQLVKQAQKEEIIRVDIATQKARYEQLKTLTKPRVTPTPKIVTQPKPSVIKINPIQALTTATLLRDITALDIVTTLVVVDSIERLRRPTTE